MPYLGEIRVFAGNFAPVNWAKCQGQTVPISENETLFNLIGTTYGGDGQETFMLPDLRGRVPVHMGRGPDVTQTYVIGETFGQKDVTLNVQQIPNHTHAFAASSAGGVTASPQGSVLASPPSVTMFLRDSPSTAMPVQMVQPTGGSQPHENHMPTIAVNYIICLFGGVFPSQ